MRLLTSLADYGHYRVLTVVGEVDLATDQEFRDALVQAVESNGSALLVDMTYVRFGDSAGLNAVAAIHYRAHAREQPFALFTLSRELRAAFKATSLDRMVRIYPSLDAALLATFAAGG